MYGYDVNYTYCGYFAIYTNTESLCCTSETNIMFCELYFNLKISKKEKAYHTRFLKYTLLVRDIHKMYYVCMTSIWT